MHKQPECEVVVNEVKGYGSDGSSVFSMFLLDKGDAAPPVGELSEFAIGKGDDEIKGTKYSYIYTEDRLVGIGKLRPQGDRDYEYILLFGGKELHVYYCVYG